ncbi:MAG TPA: DUF58 domain-containing protein [Paludibacter sp.]|nr:DUF58 domain-containing protein [Paludibacter sp.]
MKLLKSLYLNHLFFYVLLGIGGLFFISFFVKWMFDVAVILLLIFLLITLIDIFILYAGKKGLEATRELPDRFSNGDENIIHISLTNNYPVPVLAEIIDEIPFQFQKRDFLVKLHLTGHATKAIEYSLRPTERGEYLFGKLNVYAQSPVRLVSKRYIFCENATIATYPSFMQLRKYDMMAFSNNLMEYGLKRIRRIGHTMEFEQIKEYVQGDDMRTINWKATSKKNALMVNQYQDEKSQSVYQVIDTGRSMQMPFEGLSLLDYAVNSTLALSNIVLKKQDKAGMFTFSKKVGNYVAAERRAGQMNRMMESLYRIETDFMESDFSRLYVDIKQSVTQRSLIMLYSNFETMDALRRQLTYLKGIAGNHLLILVFFDNTELNQLINRPTQNVQEVYDKIIAEKFVFEKRLIVRELQKHGIQSILTRPENRTIDTINKYLELKARGMI